MGSTPIPPILVLDSSPLQGLYRGGALEPLGKLFPQLMIPGAVDAETRKYHAEPGSAGRVPDLDGHPSIATVPVRDAELEAAGAKLIGPHRDTQLYEWRGRRIQRPELEAVLCAKLKTAALAIEDAVPAACARELGIQVFSTASLLETLQRGGFINDAQARARRIRATGYDQADLRELAGEGQGPLHGYDPRVIEPKWQARWEAARLSAAGLRPDAPKKYVLEMFPYPSGNMHMGHVRNYLIGDVLARYYRMRGFDVLHPFGWDALGLPAENAAIQDKRHPAERTAENIALFRRDTQALGLSYDWSREINTSAPSYYRWNQWFFVRMLERGIVYRRKSRVNWCPGCATVIANEQVKDDGTCERSGDVVEQREMPEWAFRITRYAQELLDGLDELKDWPDRITSMQRHWIGRSEGVEVDFVISESNEKLRVFTTRLDTIHGCTYVVVAPDDAIVDRVATRECLATIHSLRQQLAQRGTTRTNENAEKHGMATGAYAINPFSGEKVPVWVADFVIATHGTGAVMGVPAHDQRDYEFAKKYDLPIKSVIVPTQPGAEVPSGAAFTGEGTLVDSGAATGLASGEARQKLAAEAEARGFGNKAVHWHLRDWGFSRQRYWGTPIPIVYCEKCDPEGMGIPVPDQDLPVLLPDIDVAVVLTGLGEPPLARVPEFVNTTCPRCGGPARREVETMDTFVDSAWYHARFVSPEHVGAPFERSAADRWLPVDVYVGGPEHAVMHLLYFRFWSRVMKEMGLVGVAEPVKRLITQGIVNGPDGRKMSKRWGNDINSRSIIEKYGADTARMFVMFAGPPENDIAWSYQQVAGQYRFAGRLWRLAFAHRDAVGKRFAGPVVGDALAIRRIAHKCLKRVTESVEKLSFNTAIAGVMEAVKALYALEKASGPNVAAAWAEAVRFLAVCMSPFTPHLADELAEAFGDVEPLQAQRWPEFDPALVVDDSVSYAVQVNGKLRAEVAMPIAAAEAEVRLAAEAVEAVKAHLADKPVRKFVFVPGRLVNFVVG